MPSGSILLFLSFVALVSTKHQVFTEANAVVTTPQYPSTKIEWNGTIEIKAYVGHRIRIQILDFAQTYSLTKLTIFDGNQSSTVLASFDENFDSDSVVHFYSTSNLLTLVYSLASFDRGYKFQYHLFRINKATNETDIKKLKRHYGCQENQFAFRNTCLQTHLFDETVSFKTALQSCSSKKIVNIADLETQNAITEATDAALRFKITHRVDPFRIFVGGEYLVQNNATGIQSDGYYWKNGTTQVKVKDVMWDQSQPFEKTTNNGTTDVHLAYDWYISKVAQKARIHTVSCSGTNCDQDMRGVVCVHPRIEVYYREQCTIPE